MKNIISITIALSAVCLAALSGCDGKDYTLAPVSGTVTFDGKPVPKLLVNLSPKPVGENYAVGPFSQGKTDSEGKFTLKTRYDDEGAVVGKHTLTLMYSDIGETEMSDLRVNMRESQDEGDKANFDKYKQKIEALKAKLKGRPILKGEYKVPIDVPADGLQDFKMELNEI